MTSGSIFWDYEDTDNRNSVNGTVPSGVYDQDTLIRFCCKTGGDVSAPIALPSHSPFYLFPYTTQCQQVQGMDTVAEWVVWRVDRFKYAYLNGNHPDVSYDSTKLDLGYCYYTKI